MLCTRRLPLLLISLSILFFCSNAYAWWNEGWQYRKKIAFNTTQHGADIAENQNDIPILIRLHTGNFNFGNAKQDGTDLRFVASDDKTQLKHHLERFDTIDEIALIWVKVPRLPANSDQDFIWLYYGNESAAGGQDAKSTYEGGYAAVFHFAETEGPPQDSSPAGNHATHFSGGQGLP
jgi:biopolymer transport protein ExbB